MTETPDAREISEDTITKMVAQADPQWTVSQMSPAERGFCSTYQITVTEPDTARDLYLKLSPDGRTWGIPVEARIQSVLAANSSMPVPEIHCVVDDHETLPSPFYLMEALPGDELAYEEVAHLDDDVLQQIAKETGKYLGELHSIQALDRFGLVDYDGPALAGTRPESTPSQLAVDSAEEEWPAYLSKYVGHELDRLEESQFAGVVSAIRQWTEHRIETLDGPFEPVLCRNDHGLHNLLLDATTGEITGMLDWNYSIAGVPAFDFEFATYIYSGAFFDCLSTVPDRRSLVRQAMVAGYQSSAPPSMVESVERPAPLYELLAIVRIMNDFETLDCPDRTSEQVTEHLRSEALSRVEESDS